MTTLISNIPAEKQAKRGWKVEIDGKPVGHVEKISITHPSFGELAYGLTPPGYDGWSFCEHGGGGAVIVPYCITRGRLFIGLVEQQRHNQGGKVLNVPRGFLSPGETHFQAAAREFTEETSLAVVPSSVTALSGVPLNPNSAFFETAGEGDGVKCYAVNVDESLLCAAESSGRLAFRAGVLKADAASKQAKLAEQILGCVFVPVADAARVGDMFTVAVVARLAASLGRIG